MERPGTAARPGTVERVECGYWAVGGGGSFPPTTARRRQEGPGAGPGAVHPKELTVEGASGGRGQFPGPPALTGGGAQRLGETGNPRGRDGLDELPDWWET